MGPLPNGLCMAYKWVTIATYDTWDDPPSDDLFFSINCPNGDLKNIPQILIKEKLI